MYAAFTEVLLVVWKRGTDGNVVGREYLRSHLEIFYGFPTGDRHVFIQGAISTSLGTLYDFLRKCRLS